MARRRQPQRRFGMGEWFGQSLPLLTPEQRADYAQVAISRQQRGMPCPAQEQCTKRGGVCSLRLYSRDPLTEEIAPVAGADGRLRTVCPVRFYQGGVIYQWVGEVILGDPNPLPLGEITFLERPGADDGEGEDVGRIDRVLVSRPQEGHPLKWCALEVQAVYFSGGEMAADWRAIIAQVGDSLPFPTKNRRPDYRSSGPKRLMPQLQIKVPSLRRWGKKMAVVVDEDFFASLTEMDNVTDISNADVAWFVVGYDEGPGGFTVARRFVRFTTLERAVEGLTAGLPVSLSAFEERIRAKLP